MKLCVCFSHVPWKMSTPARYQIYVWFLSRSKMRESKVENLERALNDPWRLCKIPSIVRRICEYDGLSQLTKQKWRDFLDVIKGFNQLALSWSKGDYFGFWRPFTRRFTSSLSTEGLPCWPWTSKLPGCRKDYGKGPMARTKRLPLTVERGPCLEPSSKQNILVCS